MGKFNIITLCGSTRFKDEFEMINKHLTLKGNVVISVGLFGHSGDTVSDEEKELLDRIHKAKIDLCDEIFVINKDGYIGESTLSEIDYAIKNNKEIKYLCNEWSKSRFDIDKYPIGTKFRSYTGGYWIKVKTGYKWCTGAIFPRVGGDYDGYVKLPKQD